MCAAESMVVDEVKVEGVLIVERCVTVGNVDR
jgi:hypothetical protein